MVLPGMKTVEACEGKRQVLVGASKKPLQPSPDALLRISLRNSRLYIDPV
jgi:hypothetical protein